LFILYYNYNFFNKNQREKEEGLRNIKITGKFGLVRGWNIRGKRQGKMGCRRQVILIGPIRLYLKSGS
jgi:hypothetical protein